MTPARAVERTSTKSTWTWMPGFPAEVPGILGLRPQKSGVPSLMIGDELSRLDFARGLEDQPIL